MGYLMLSGCIFLLLDKLLHHTDLLNDWQKTEEKVVRIVSYEDVVKTLTTDGVLEAYEEKSEEETKRSHESGRDNVTKDQSEEEYERALRY